MNGIVLQDISVTQVGPGSYASTTRFIDFPKPNPAIDALIKFVKVAVAMASGISFIEAKRSVLPPTYSQRYGERWDSDRRARQMQAFIVDRDVREAHPAVYPHA